MAPEQVSEPGSAGPKSSLSLKKLVEKLARALVDDAEAVRVEEIRRSKIIELTLSVAPGDIRRVIGRESRVDNAIRAILQASARRRGQWVFLEIVVGRLSQADRADK